MGSGSTPRLNPSAKLALRFGRIMDAVFTWGLEPSLRADLMKERRADRMEEVAEGTGLRNLIGRSLRSAGGDLRARLNDRASVTALPVAFTYLLLGLAAAVLATRPMSTPQRASYVALIAGLLTVGTAGILTPRALHRARIGAGSGLISIGAFLNAATFNVVDSTLLSDAALTLVLVLAGAGYLGVAIGLAALDERLLRIGGWGVMAALMALVAGVALWALENSISGPSEALGAVLLAVGCVVGANSFARLRHLPIEHRKARPAA